MPVSSDSQTLWSPARILMPDGLEIARGAIKLVLPPAEGTFEPEHPASPSLDIPSGSILVAETENGRYSLADWQRCRSTCHLDAPRKPVGVHFHFVLMLIEPEHG